MPLIEAYRLLQNCILRTSDYPITPCNYLHTRSALLIALGVLRLAYAIGRAKSGDPRIRLVGMTSIVLAKVADQAHTWILTEGRGLTANPKGPRHHSSQNQELTP